VSHFRTLRFRDWPLRWKMIVLLVAASALPLAAAAVVGVHNASEQIRRDAAEVLIARAEQLAGEVDQFHRVYVTSVTRLGEFPEVRGFLLADSDGRDDRRSQLRTVLEIHERTDPNIRGLAVIDAAGTVVMATERGLEGIPIRFRPHFQKALAGQLAISDVYVSLPLSGSTPSIAYVAPVVSNGRVVGMVAIYVRAAALWKTIRAANGRAGIGSYMVLLDRYGIRIGHSARANLLFKPTARLDGPTIDRLVEEERFVGRTRALLETPVTAPEEYFRARTSMQSDVFRERGEGEGWTLAAERRLRTVPWTVFAFVPETSFLAPIHRLYRDTLLACAAILLFALAVGSLLARHIIRPAGFLAQAAAKISKGDLAARVPEGRGDELGRLAGEFNRMADALERGRDNLETEVSDRTQALERARSELEARNAKLAEWSAEIARRQTWDLAFGRTLTALAGDGPLERVLLAGLTEASLPVGAAVAVCFRVAEGGELLFIGGTTQPAKIRAIAESASNRAAAALTTRHTLVLEGPWDAGVDVVEPDALGARCAAVALVPLVVGERAVGVLVVGGPRFSHEALSFLEDLAVPLALTISRHDLGEQTGRFAEELGRRNETLRLQAEELASQRDEMRSQHRELEAKSREVERANQLKSEFLANMSHELRTPLNAVIGFSELLMEEAGETLTPRQARWAEDILAAGRHLLSLINDILDLAKIEAGRASLALEPLAAEDAIGDALTLIIPAARRKQITVRPLVRTQRRAMADRGKIRQILLNLLSNSVKFCPDGATVEIGAEDRGDSVRFWVRDEGPGIDPSLREKLFQPFVQGESALVKKHQGTGLGLVISKRLVEQHGGTIRIESGAGPGVTIGFTLPAEGTEAARAVLERDHDGGSLEAPPRSESAGESAPPAAPCAEPGSGSALALIAAAPGVAVPPAPAPPAPLPPAPAPAQPAPLARLPAGSQPGPGERALVLVVEDNPASARLLQDTLADAGYDVALAETVDEALAVTVRLRPAAILLDIILEDEDGLELLRELKRDPTTRDIPVVIQSVLGDPRRALALGASEYLVKPIQRHTLLDRLQGLVLPGRGNARPTVLVIDDDPTVCDLLASTLGPAGYRVLTCDSGRRGIDLALREQPDLAVVDLMLPDISGFQIIETLAADARTRGVPIILLTAATLSGQERERLARDVHLLARKGDISMSGLLETVDRATGRARPEPPARPPAAPGAPATILVVDDHDLNRELSRALLERLGHRVLLAENGAIGVEMTRRELPDLVLMDLAMPVKDGFTAAAELKAHPLTASIPILALTALAMPGDERRALEAGFDGYLAKPIDTRHLEEAVARCLGAKTGR